MLWQSFRSAWVALKRNWKRLLWIAGIATVVEWSITLSLAVWLGPWGMVLARIPALWAAATCLSAALASHEGEKPELVRAARRTAQHAMPLLVVGAAAQTGILIFGVGVIVSSTLFAFAPIYVLRGCGLVKAMRMSMALAGRQPVSLLLLNLSLLLVAGAARVVPALAGTVIPVLSALLLISVFERTSGTLPTLPAHGGVS